MHAHTSTYICMRVCVCLCYLTHAASACCLQNRQRNATHRTSRSLSLCLFLSVVLVPPFYTSQGSMNHFRFRQQHGRHCTGRERTERESGERGAAAEAAAAAEAQQTKVNERSCCVMYVGHVVCASLSPSLCLCVCVCAFIIDLYDGRISCTNFPFLRLI